MASLTEAVEKPAHVPDEAVFDFDYHRDPALLANPHRRMRELLETAPKVFWTPRNGGTWIAIGFDEVFEALRKPEIFSSSIIPPEQIEFVNGDIVPLIIHSFRGNTGTKMGLLSLHGGTPCVS